MQRRDSLVAPPLPPANLVGLTSLGFHPLHIPCLPNANYENLLALPPQTLSSALGQKRSLPLCCDVTADFPTSTIDTVLPHAPNFFFCIPIETFPKAKWSLLNNVHPKVPS